jgi:hypothetical protein
MTETWVDVKGPAESAETGERLPGLGCTLMRAKTCGALTAASGRCRVGDRWVIHGFGTGRQVTTRAALGHYAGRHLLLESAGSGFESLAAHKRLAGCIAAWLCGLDLWVSRGCHGCAARLRALARAGLLGTHRVLVASVGPVLRIRRADLGSVASSGVAAGGFGTQPVAVDVLMLVPAVYLAVTITVTTPSRAVAREPTDRCRRRGRAAYCRQAVPSMVRQ